MHFYYALIFGLVIAIGATSAKPVDSPSQIGLDAFDSLQKNREKVMKALDDSQLISHSESTKDSTSDGNKDDSETDLKFPFSNFFSNQQKQISDGVSSVFKGAMGFGENLEKFFRDSVPTGSQVKNSARGFLDSIFGDHSKS